MRNFSLVILGLIFVVSCSEEDHRIDLSYTGEQLRFVDAPIGGIETGHMLVNGDGSIRAFNIFGSSAIDSQQSAMTFFSLYAAEEGDAAVVRIMGKEHLDDSAGGSGGSGDSGGSEGSESAESAESTGGSVEVVRNLEAASGFKEAVFHNAFPLVQVDLLDDAVPLKVRLSAWSPFIPIDILNSNLPVAVFEWELTNPGKKPVSYSLALAMQNPLGMQGQNGRFSLNEFKINTNTVSGWKGFTFSNYEGDSLIHGTGAVRVMSSSESTFYVPLIGDRQKALEQFWTDFSTDGKQESWGDNVRYSGEDPGMAALYSSGVLDPGESVAIPFLFSWFVSFGDTAERLSVDDSNPFEDKPLTPDAEEKPSTFRFESKSSDSCFKGIDDITGYMVSEYKNLRDKTMQFSHSMITSTISPEALDTVLSDFAAAVEQRDKNMAVVSKPFPDNGTNIYGIGGRSAWNIYYATSGFAYDKEERVMKFSPAIDVLPVRFFWATESGWGTINVSRARIVLDCIYGSLNLKQLYLEGRSFFVFREYVPSQNAVVSYNNETLIINFTEKSHISEGGSFTMEIP